MQEKQRREKEKILLERIAQPSLDEVQSSESSSTFPVLRESEVGAFEAHIMAED